MPESLMRPTKSKWSRYLKSYLPFWQRDRIGFWGNFGHGDLGDDAAFLVGREIFGRKTIPVSKRCFAFNPRMYRAFLIGGGGALRWETPYLPRRFFLKEKWPFPVVLFGAGINRDFGREYSPEAKEKIQALCERCDYLTVRDELTASLVKSLGFDRVGVLPDLEFALKEQKREFSFQKKGETVGLVLTPHSEFDDATLAKISVTFAAFMDEVTARGGQVLLLPFENEKYGSDREQKLIQTIIGRVRQRDRVMVLPSNLGPGEMLFAVKEFCDWMVCMRMHSMVFAVNAGVPFLGISYNEMHRGFLQAVNMPEHEIKLEEFSKDLLIEKYEWLRKSREEIKKHLLAVRDKLRLKIREELEKIKQLTLK